MKAILAESGPSRFTEFRPVSIPYDEQDYLTETILNTASEIEQNPYVIPDTSITRLRDIPLITADRRADRGRRPSLAADIELHHGEIHQAAIRFLHSPSRGVADNLLLLSPESSDWRYISPENMRYVHAASVATLIHESVRSNDIVAHFDPFMDSTVTPPQVAEILADLPGSTIPARQLINRYTHDSVVSDSHDTLFPVETLLEIDRETSRRHRSIVRLSRSAVYAALGGEIKKTYQYTILTDRTGDAVRTSGTLSLETNDNGPAKVLRPFLYADYEDPDSIEGSFAAKSLYEGLRQLRSQRIIEDDIAA